jgi:DNA-binding LytR/AlgR family response regulator
LLQDYLARLPFFQAPTVCKTAQEALMLMQQQAFDLVFLDMRLPDQTGVELLRSFPKALPIIATTAYADYAVDSYDLNVIDYLLKPFSFQRFTRALNRALGIRLATNSLVEQNFIFLKAGHSVQRFDYAAIDYIQAFGTYTKVSAYQKVFVVNETISNLENLLPESQFLRIHKSYIINVSKIANYTYREVTIASTKIPLGASYRDRFQGFLNLLEKNKSV